MKSEYLLPQDDGLSTREFNKWTAEKVDYLRRYIYMFGVSMKNMKLRRRSFIDLFCGTGKFKIEGSSNYYLGSSLIALTAEVPFTHYYFSDSNAENVEILQKRSASLDFQKKFMVGDSNKLVRDIVDELLTVDKKYIPGVWPSLNLAFLDPDGLELEWQTVATLASVNRMDLIIHYSQGGLTRNLSKFFAAEGETLIDRFFGDTEWREIYAHHRDKPEGVHRYLIDHYKEKLQSLGYKEIKEEGWTEPLLRNRRRVPLYRLLFASKHELGNEFWKTVTERDMYGQKPLL
ncbi:MAG TPA: three-Cys-motif partner protein TcmP [Anaerolineales bacterium]|nr:three-Cys-motif partner protein TcmP [Anaerolineales bacterium]